MKIAMNHRKKQRECPNPLFLKWLEDWRDEAKQKNSKLQFTYGKVGYNSMVNFKSFSVFNSTHALFILRLKFIFYKRMRTKGDICAQCAAIKSRCDKLCLPMKPQKTDAFRCLSTGVLVECRACDVWALRFPFLLTHR